MVRSNFTADRMTVTGVDSTTNQPVIESSLSSTVKVMDSTIKDNKIPFISSVASIFESTGSTYKNISSPKEIFFFETSTVTLTGSKFINLTSATKSPILFKKSITSSMVNCEVEGIKQICAHVSKSTLTVRNTTIKQSHKGFTLYDSVVVIDNSTFIELGSTTQTIK